tara:strand:- start:4803 stop:5273 length:471 start_codon:yes stop_codon:yes gene_type:complete
MSGFTGAGILPTTVTTTQQAPLGFILTVPDGNNGNKEYMYVYNDSGSTLAIKEMVMRKSQSQTYAAAKAEANCVSARVLGVPETAIPNGSYGFVVRRGVTTVSAGEALAVDIPLKIHSTAGTVADAVASTLGGDIGQSLAAVGGAGDAVVFLSCKG